MEVVLFLQKHCVLILLGLLLSAAVSGEAYAQDSPAALSAVQITDLKHWMKDDADYLKWYKTWGNTARVKLRHRPLPPDWLAAECGNLFGGEGLMVDACDLLKEITEDAGSSNLRRTQVERRVQKEAPAKTQFIERVHFGGGWPMVMGLGGFKYGGLLESHVSIASVGRFEANLPGIIILSLPSQKGGREIKLGTDIGGSFRLGSFQVPGVRQAYVLHLNIANAWTFDGGFGSQNRLSLAGLSVTMKKNP